MSPEEIDAAIEDVEVRLERVRSLYEQYFLGIERIPPAVARKDLDRRIWQLRRSQIRNTAKRFKLQTIIQRYNTFQQYWQRICREIENGTYKRHLLRAERSQGASAQLTVAARKRLGLKKADADTEGRAEATRKRLEGDLAAALDGDYDPVAEAKRAMDAVLGHEPAEAKPRATPAPAEARKAPNEAPGAAALGKLELDLDDDLFGAAPPAPAPSPKPTLAKSAARPKPKAPAVSAGAKPAAEPKPPPPAAKPAAEPKPPPPAAKPAAEPKSPPPAASPAAAAAKPAAPEASPATAAAKPAAPDATQPAEPAATRAKAVASGPSPKPGSPPPPPRRAAGKPPPVPARASGQPRPPPPPVRPKPEAKPAPSQGDRRVADLHARLVAAKRKTNDTSQVSVDSLARSLKKAETKLREQHGNRKIEFDVVIKNGKAVVKPILR